MKISGKRIFGLGAVAFVLNWVWEMAQMFAFELPSGVHTVLMTVFCTAATVVDALVTIGIYALLIKIGLKSLNAAFYFLAGALGATCAVVFERFAFAFGLWSYNDLMPLVPIIEVGLLPFIQLALLVPAAIALTEKLSGERSPQNN
jgi:hypothetical protein